MWVVTQQMFANKHPVAGMPSQRSHRRIPTPSSVSTTRSSALRSQFPAQFPLHSSTYDCSARNLGLETLRNANWINNIQLWHNNTNWFRSPFLVQLDVWKYPHTYTQSCRMLHIRIVVKMPPRICVCKRCICLCLNAYICADTHPSVALECVPRIRAEVSVASNVCLT